MVTAVILTSASGVFGQPSTLHQVPGYCIPPERPLLDAASLQILDLTMGEELARYMNEAQAYGQCLDDTKRRLNNEVNQYLKQYRGSANG